MARDIVYTDFMEIHKYISPDQRDYVIKKAEDYKNDLFVVGFHLLHNESPPTIRMTVFVNPDGTAVDVELPLDDFLKLRRFRKEEEPEATVEPKSKRAKGAAKGETMAEEFEASEKELELKDQPPGFLRGTGHIGKASDA